MNGNMLLPNYAVFIALFILLILLSFLIILWNRNQILRVKNQKTEEYNQLIEQQLNKAELEKIETKLNPHLFKNVLNSIQSHAYQTYISLDKLANILDYILYESGNQFVSLKQEIDFAKNLIEINKIKINPLFDFRIKTKIDREDSLIQEKIFTPLISVDLIENAFKHADFLASDAFISIYIEFQNGIFRLSVSNKISKKESLKKEHSGFGSDSLNQRLKLIYKDCYTLEKHTEKDIFTADLKINLLEYYNKVRYLR